MTTFHAAIKQPALLIVEDDEARRFAAADMYGQHISVQLSRPVHETETTGVSLPASSQAGHFLNTILHYRFFNRS
jgi:hypothetical protein